MILQVFEGDILTKIDCYVTSWSLVGGLVRVGFWKTLIREFPSRTPGGGV